MHTVRRTTLRKPSRILTQPSNSIQLLPWRTTTAEWRNITRATLVLRPPTLMKPFTLIRVLELHIPTAASRIWLSGTSTAQLAILMKQFGGSPAQPSHISTGLLHTAARDGFLTQLRTSALQSNTILHLRSHTACVASLACGRGMVTWLWPIFRRPFGSIQSSLGPT